MNKKHSGPYTDFEEEKYPLLLPGAKRTQITLSQEDVYDTSNASRKRVKFPRRESHSAESDINLFCHFIYPELSTKVLHLTSYLHPFSMQHRKINKCNPTLSVAFKNFLPCTQIIFKWNSIKNSKNDFSLASGIFKFGVPFLLTSKVLNHNNYL
jgi:hypothetical protein